MANEHCIRHVKAHQNNNQLTKYILKIDNVQQTKHVEIFHQKSTIDTHKHTFLTSKIENEAEKEKIQEENERRS